jgi:hypothetical protein
MQWSPLVARRHYIHRIPPHVRDDAYVPLVEAEHRYDNHNFSKIGSRIFLTLGLDSISENQAIGQINAA